MYKMVQSESILATWTEKKLQSIFLNQIFEELDYSGHGFNNINKNSSGDEIANVNFYAVRPEATQIR